MGDPTSAGVVLCGGGSRRMGTDKAALPFGDESLLERIVRLLTPEVAEIWLVARESQPIPDVRVAGRALRIARDPAEGLGPLAGIAAALRAIEAERAFVVSCDSPLLQPALVGHLLELAREHRAAIPRVDGHLVPTLAVYGKSLLPVAEDLLARGERRPRRLADQPGVRIVEEKELRAGDPELLSFRDCDTPEQYRDLLERAGLGPASSRMLSPR